MLSAIKEECRQETLICIVGDFQFFGINWNSLEYNTTNAELFVELTRHRTVTLPMFSNQRDNRICYI